MSEKLERVLNSKKIRYGTLNNLFNNVLDNNDADEITLFIDANSILSNLYNPDFSDLFKTLDPKEKYMTSSDIINLAGHFRHYFYSRHRLYSNIYIYFSFDECKDLININPDYKKNHRLKYQSSNSQYYNIHKTIKKNMELAGVISTFLPKIYMIDAKGIDTNVIPQYIMNKYHKDTKGLSVIYSNNPLALQYCDSSKNRYVLNSKWDSSELIDESDVYKSLLSTKEYNSVDITFTNDLLVPFMSMSGITKYNMKGVTGYGKIKSIKLINEALNNTLISNTNYEDPNLFISSISSLMKKDHQKEYIDSFKQTSVNYYYNTFLKHSDRLSIDGQIIDRIDAKSLRFINEKYYDRYPLTVEFLIDGEEYE